MAAYPYTLQLIPLELSVDEQRAAQRGLLNAQIDQQRRFIKTQIDTQLSALGKTRLTPKTWAILAAVIAAGIAGVILANGYSTVPFWVMIGGAILFLIIRFLVFPYAQKYMMNRQLAEVERQIAQQIKDAERQLAEQPLEPVRGMKIGVQAHGLILQQTINGRMGQGEIKWRDVQNWFETPDYLYLFLNQQGQQGMQIFPKRLAAQKFPFETVRKQLTDLLGPAALPMPEQAPMALQ